MTYAPPYFSWRGPSYYGPLTYDLRTLYIHRWPVGSYLAVIRRGVASGPSATYGPTAHIYIAVGATAAEEIKVRPALAVGRAAKGNTAW